MFHENIYKEYDTSQCTYVTLNNDEDKINKIELEYYQHLNYLRFMQGMILGIVLGNIIGVLLAIINMY